MKIVESGTSSIARTGDWRRSAARTSTPASTSLEIFSKTVNDDEDDDDDDKDEYAMGGCW